MADYICHHKGLYFIWSTVVDAPVSRAMTRQEFEEEYLFEFGKRGMEHLPARMLRAHANGTSAFGVSSLREQVAGNHAGDKGKEISFEEILRMVEIPEELIP